MLTYVPAEQMVHVEVDPPEYFPASHLVHVEAEVVATTPEYFPAVHPVHVPVEAATLEYFPASQASQLSLP